MKRLLSIFHRKSRQPWLFLCLASYNRGRR